MKPDQYKQQIAKARAAKMGGKKKPEANSNPKPSAGRNRLRGRY